MSTADSTLTSAQKIIVAIDGQEVTDSQDINALMDKHQAGDTISVTLYRGRKQMTIKLILGEAR